MASIYLPEVIENSDLTLVDSSLFGYFEIPKLIGTLEHPKSLDLICDEMDRAIQDLTWYIAYVSTHPKVYAVPKVKDEMKKVKEILDRKKWKSFDHNKIRSRAKKIRAQMELEDLDEEDITPHNHVCPGRALFNTYRRTVNFLYRSLKEYQEEMPLIKHCNPKISDADYQTVEASLRFAKANPDCEVSILCCDYHLPNALSRHFSYRYFGGGGAITVYNFKSSELVDKGTLEIRSIISGRV